MEIRLPAKTPGDFVLSGQWSALLRAADGGPRHSTIAEQTADILNELHTVWP